MNLDEVKLDDKYKQAGGGVYLTGTQALVKIAILQGMCDRQAELLDSWHNLLSQVTAVRSNRLQRRQQLVRDHPQAVQRC